MPVHPAFSWTTWRSGTAMVKNKRPDSHCSKWFDGEQMVIASRQMRSADDHKSTYTAVSRYVADFAVTAWAEVAFTLELGMANAERGQRCIRKTCREAHHHQFRSDGCCCRRRRRCSIWGGAWRPSTWGDWRRDEFKEHILEVTLVHCNPKCT